MIPSSYIPEVHLSQYDIGRELTFKLMDGNTEYSVPSGATVTVKATKPSGLGFVVSGTFSGNIVTIVNTETMTNESGRFSAELSISSGATLLGTSNFIFNIERSPHPEGTVDGDAETLLPELRLLVTEIRESNAKVESMTASATSLPAGSDPTAEYDSEENNLAFGIPVPEVTEEDLYKAFIVKSASGSIASFSDGGDDLPMKSLVVNIVLKQSGSGDPSPSNVRPISGWDSVAVNVSGADTSDYETITTNLPQTVYGGTLEVVSGKLVIDKGYVDLGSINWVKLTNATKTFFQTMSEIADMKKSSGTNVLQGFICSCYKEKTWYQTLDNASIDKAICEGWNGKSYIAIADSTYVDLSASEFKTAMNGVQLVYELATQTEIQLTPTEVKTLLGANNIWSESGTVEVEYRADSTLAYNELVAMILENIGG